MENTLDVRDLPAASRHAKIFQALAALHPGERLLLINDHDPKPLYYQLQAEHPGQFLWSYIEKGPETWRVMIEKVAPAASGSKLGTPKPAWLSSPVAHELDVRPILARGEEPFETIMQRARQVEAGQRLVLLAPFEPVPLYQALAPLGFEAWCEQEAGLYRVHFYRKG